MNSRRQGWDTRRGRLRGIRTCPLRQSSACLGSQERGVPCTECHSSLGRERARVERMTTVSRQSEERKSVERMIVETLLSPLSSVSHVSMTAPVMGSPLEVSTRPSTDMYSPFPSDAIDSPSGTVDVISCGPVRA